MSTTNKAYVISLKTIRNRLVTVEGYILLRKLLRRVFWWLFRS
ncbi:hypothetical protein SPFM7_00110 [Salmonella phage SPFM7]|nr:hypothetical protein SPFM7_00110 [Salmonella phage SPFM7]